MDKIIIFFAKILIVLLYISIFISIGCGIYLFTLYKIHIDYFSFGVLLTILVPFHIYKCIKDISWWIELKELV